MISSENLESRVLFSAGAVDRPFGVGGRSDTPAGQSDELIVVQSNGSFIVAGSVQNSDLSTHGFLERYHANGKVDPSFGSHGRIDLDSAQFADVLSVALAPGGKIVALGTDANGDDLLTRFSSNGKLDAIFGSAGIAPLPADTSSPKVKVETDGSIVVAADMNGTGELLHYTRAGTVDTHFGVDGVATTEAGVGYAIGDFELPGHGKIEALFYSPGGPAGGPQTALERFNPDGTLDLTFTQSLGGIIPASNANRFLPDGSILSLGSSATGTLTATHYNAQGILDVRFGAQGPAMLAFPPNNGDSTDRAVVEPSYKLLLIENGSSGTTPYIALGGLTANGKIDKPFGRTGVVPVSPAGDIIAVAGDGSHVILLENANGSLQTDAILAYDI